jgi:hypothetical protein
LIYKLADKMMKLHADEIMLQIGIGLIMPLTYDNAICRLLYYMPELTMNRDYADVA